MAAPPAATEGVPRVLRPLVWLVALLCLPVKVGLRGGVRVLEGYERGSDAVGRVVARAARAVGRLALRVLGPAGRLLVRLLSPAAVVLRRAWDRVGLWLLLRLLRPIGRWSRRLLRAARPTLMLLGRWGRAGLERLEPPARLLLSAASAIERTVDRLAAVVRRAWRPVGRALSALRPSRSRG